VTVPVNWIKKPLHGQYIKKYSKITGETNKMIKNPTSATISGVKFKLNDAWCHYWSHEFNSLASGNILVTVQQS